jgi:predicted esterase
MPRTTGRAAAILAAAASLALAGCGGGGGGARVAPAGPLESSTQRAPQSAALGTYPIDRSKIMVSGVSSGAYMATQLQVAYSKTFKGAAIFAGGPYFCAQDNLTIALDDCTNNDFSTNVPLLEQDTDNTAFFGYIDPTSNLSGQKAYLFSGTNDTTVYPSVVRDLKTYYQHYGVVVTTNFTTAAGHAWISPDGTNACGVTSSPYVNACGFDAEQTFLTLLYGTLNARRTGALTGSLLQFNQNPYLPGGYAPSYSMDQNGYVYVPANCAAGQTCKLLVALHGCLQGAATVGTAFVTKSGLNEWADTNNLIVLYPQAIASASNPNGCWDWWGYLSTNYAAKAGPQMAAVYGMVQHI